MEAADSLSAEVVIAYFCEYFSLIMLGLAVVLAVLCTAVRRSGFVGELFRWTALLAAGVVGVYTFVLHVFFSEVTAANIGWQTSPFQYEVGIADLATGVLGVMAFAASRGFRWAATVACSIWFWGDAVGHVHQMIVANNYAPGNAGPWFWTDVLVPLVMLSTMIASGGRSEDR